MLKISLVLSVQLIISTAQAQSPTPKSLVKITASEQKVSPSRVPVMVPEGVKELKEDSLPADNASNADTKNEVSATPAAPVQIKKFYNEKGELYVTDSVWPGSQDAKERNNQGMRQYMFTLKPREEIDFRIKGVPPDKMSMSFGVPVTADPMVSYLRRINRTPKVARSTRLNFTNQLDAPYTFVLILSGNVGYPYRLEIARK